MIPSQPSLAQLRQWSDDQLRAEFDSYAGVRQNPNPELYLAELNRRAQDRQTMAMLEYTKTMRNLTWVIAALTLVVTVATIMALWVALHPPPAHA
jgi:hypothetical protein